MSICNYRAAEIFSDATFLQQSQRMRNAVGNGLWSTKWHYVRNCIRLKVRCGFISQGFDNHPVDDEGAEELVPAVPVGVSGRKM